jgi:hypothetical protein
MSRPGPGFKIYREPMRTAMARRARNLNIGEGLRSYLPDVSVGMSGRDLLWAIKIVIRMTGIASNGKVRDDDEISPLVAFVQPLQKIDARSVTSTVEQSGHLIGG